jgi:hypothetical protein
MECPKYREFDYYVKPYIKKLINNKSNVSIVVNLSMIIDNKNIEEQTTTFLDAKELRTLAKYLDYLDRK